MFVSKLYFESLTGHPCKTKARVVSRASWFEGQGYWPGYRICWEFGMRMCSKVVNDMAKIITFINVI